MKKLLSLLLIIVTSVQAQGIGVSFGPGPNVSYGGSGAYPVIATTATGTDSVGSTSSAVNMPASIGVGDLLLIFGIIQSTTPGTVTITGWTCANDVPASATSTTIWCYRTADGTEGSTQTASWTSSQRNRWICLRITGTATTPEASAGVATVISVTPDGGTSLSPSWGSAKTLFLSNMGSGTNVTAINSVPSGYTSSVITSAGTGGAIGVAYKQVNGASEDPGNWGTNSATWNGKTIAVKGT